MVRGQPVSRWPRCPPVSRRGASKDSRRRQVIVEARVIIKHLFRQASAPTARKAAIRVPLQHIRPDEDREDQHSEMLAAPQSSAWPVTHTHTGQAQPPQPRAASEGSLCLRSHKKGFSVLKLFPESLDYDGFVLFFKMKSAELALLALETWSLEVPWCTGSEVRELGSTRSSLLHRKAPEIMIKGPGACCGSDTLAYLSLSPLSQQGKLSQRQLTQLGQGREGQSGCWRKVTDIKSTLSSSMLPVADKFTIKVNVV